MLLGGGIAATPKSMSLISSLFSQATFPRPGKAGAGNISTASEAQAVGAALHARLISMEGLLDTFITPPSAVEMPCIPIGLSISTEACGDATEQCCTLVAAGTPLPASVSIPVIVAAGPQSYFKLVDTNDNTLANIVFSAAEGETYRIQVSISATGDISLQVVSASDKEGGNPVVSVDVPAL